MTFTTDKDNYLNGSNWIASTRVITSICLLVLIDFHFVQGTTQKKRYRPSAVIIDRQNTNDFYQKWSSCTYDFKQFVTEGFIWHFQNVSYSLSCWELDVKVDTEVEFSFA